MMSRRFTLTEIKKFIRNAKKDYKSSSDTITKNDKKNCYKRIAKTMFSMVWSSVSAPFIYPVWYFFRETITNRIYRGASWEEIHCMVKNNETEAARIKLKANGKFLYWLWTYGDIDDPLGRGGMPAWYGKNDFFHRWKWGAIRNPRFNVNYMDFRTGRIVSVVDIIDDRNFHYYHVSHGIGDSPDGIYFKWMKDNNDKWFFIYEDNNAKNIFYIGYTGLLYEDIDNSGGRFETSYRKTVFSYCKES